MVRPIFCLWLRTIRTRWHGAEALVAARAGGRRVIYAMWHEYSLNLTWTHRGRGAQVLVSRHTDGELMARFLGKLGFQSIRGSSTRGGAAAFRGMLAVADGSRDFALTPDGPKGPRRKVKAGVVRLAAETGWAIVPTAVGFRRCWRAGSWDRMAVPYPFTRALGVFGDPIEVGDSDDECAAAQQLLEERMLALTAHVDDNFEELYRTGEKDLHKVDPPPDA